MKYSDIRLNALTASSVFPKETVTPVTVPKVQVSSEEWNNLVKVAKEEAGDVDAIRRDLVPLLFTNDLVNENDYIKTDYANNAIKRLYLNVTPAEGHRFVLNYFCKYDTVVEVQFYDYDETEGTSSLLLRGRFAMDSKVPLVYNDTTYGYIYVKSVSVNTIQNSGEGLARLPYMTESCFTEFGGWEDMKERVSAAETNISGLQSSQSAEVTRATNAEEALNTRLTTVEESVKNELFGSELVETSDRTLLTRAQSCIRYLYMLDAPPSGRRYVLNYMVKNGTGDYMGINICTVEEDDTASETVQAYVRTLNYEMDKKVPLYDNGTDKNILGYIYISSESYAGAVENNGQGAWRMPYLTDTCLKEDQGTKSLEVRLKNAQDEIDETKQDISSIQNELTNINAAMDDMEEDNDNAVALLNSNITTLTNRTNTNSQQLSAVQSQMSTNMTAANTRISNLNTSLAAVQTELASLQNAVASQGGTFYGYFASSADLPEGSSIGYAYVGASSPWDIWNYTGTAWEDSGTKKCDSDADEEDLTEGTDGKLKLKNRTGTNGKKYIILRTDATFASQIAEQTDAIFEIRYDFDLEGADVTIPTGCVLKFNGGSLRNFGSLVGQDTAIEAADVQILDYDCSSQYIDGTWIVDAWRSSWFGAVPDGTVTNDSTAFTTTFAGTDNWNALQGLFDAAYKTNVKEARILAGFYRVSLPLNAGWPGQFNTIRVKGSSTYGDYNMGYNKGKYVTMLLIDHWQYGISVNGSHGSVIEDVGLMGRNYQWAVSHSLTNSHSYNTLNYLDEESYIGTDMMNSAPDGGLSRFAPYAGIVTDALGWNSDVDAASNKESYYCADYDAETVIRYDVDASPFWNGTDEVSQSSRTVLKNCTVQGFGVGVCLAPNNRWGNNEFTIIENCKLVDDVICLAQGNRDARHTSVSNTILNGGFVGVDTVRFGCLKGTIMGLFQNCNFDALCNIFEIYRSDDVKMINCYAENTVRLGRVVYVYERSTPMVIYASTFFFKASVNDATPVPDYMIKGDNIIFDCSLLWGFKNMFTVAFAGDEGAGTKNIVFRDSRVYNTQVGAAITPLVFNSPRPLTFGYELIKSNQLDRTPTTSAASRNVYVYRTKNYAGSLARKVLRTQGWTVTHSISSAGIVTISFSGTFFNHTGAVAVGDLVTNNLTSIVLVVTSVDGQTVTCRPLSGYKVTNGGYELIDDYYGDYFTFWNVRQVPLSRPAIVTAVNGTTLTLDTFDSTLMAVGNMVDWESYDDSIVMDSDWKSVITAVDSEAKTITLSSAPVYALGLKVRGVIVNDETAYSLLNLTD